MFMYQNLNQLFFPSLCYQTWNLTSSGLATEGKEKKKKLSVTPTRGEGFAESRVWEVSRDVERWTSADWRIVHILLPANLILSRRLCLSCLVAELNQTAIEEQRTDDDGRVEGGQHLMWLVELPELPQRVQPRLNLLLDRVIVDGPLQVSGDCGFQELPGGSDCTSGPAATILKLTTVVSSAYFRGFTEESHEVWKIEMAKQLLFLLHFSDNMWCHFMPAHKHFQHVGGACWTTWKTSLWSCYDRHFQGWHYMVNIYGQFVCCPVCKHPTGIRDTRSWHSANNLTSGWAHG